MSYQVIARKYRPQKFSDVVGQEHITRTLQNAIDANRLHHAYLFTGVRGVGKTTLARIFSKALNCKDGPAKEPCNKCPLCEEITTGVSLDVREIDGASNTGVDDVREIRDNVKFLPASGRYKIYIIDEVHMLSTAAFNALLKTLEEPPEHVIFIFATTEPQKIPATILSRCQRYDFRRISSTKIVETLKIIAESEGVSAGADILSIVAREAEGSMRDAESLFDQAVAYSGKKVTYESLKELLGFLDRDKLFLAVRAIVEKDTKKVLTVSEDLFQSGANLNRFVLDLLLQFRNLLVIKSGGSAENDVLPDELNILKDLSGKVSIEECQQWFNMLYSGAEDISRTKFPKMVLDVLLVNLSQIRPVESVSELLERVERMQGAVTSGQWPVASGQSEKQRSAVSGQPLVVSKTNDQRPTTNDRSNKSWNDFFAWLKTKKPQIASILEHAVSCEIADSAIIIKFPAASLHGDMLTEPDRKLAVEKLALDFFKTPMKLTVEFAGAGAAPEVSAQKQSEQIKRKQLKEEALSHEMVKEAVNVFGAEVREIRTK